MELEVLEVREETDEIQDLSGRALGFLEGKGSEGGREMAETLLNPRHKLGYLKVIYSKFLEVRECGKVTQGAPVEPSGSELDVLLQADPKSLDEWK